MVGWWSICVVVGWWGGVVWCSGVCVRGSVCVWWCECCGV